jgi:CubicO group peptidase (beta-lactamase class C family)
MKTRTKTIVCISLIMLMIFCSVLMAQTVNPREFSKQVDRLLMEQIKATEPGAAVVITVKGKPIFKKCYGLADVEHNIPITSKTMFNLASVSKQFTAFSILLLEKEGKIKLDDDIHKYLPDLPNYGSPVTIRNLLNHTSGIWEYYSTMVYYCGYDKDDHFTLREDMALLKQQKKLLFEPGSQWSYCNTNYLLLAQIVEKITGVSFQEWTKSHIFEPVGMKDSFFMKNSSQIIESKADPYKKVENEFVRDNGNWTNAVGMGYLFTNIDDMILWMDNFRTMKVGGSDVIEKMFKKATLTNGNESFYGFGLGILTRSGKKIIGHSGQTAGYKTAMLYCPELELGIAILANNRSINSEGLSNTIFDLYTGKKITTEPTSTEEEPFIPFNPESAAEFAGGYIIEGTNTKVAVNVEDDYLHSALWGLGEDFFHPLNEKKYANRSRVTFIEFDKNKDGILHVVVHGDEMTAHRIILDKNVLKSRLPEYIGSYYSDAFRTVYDFRIRDGQTFMHHRRRGDMRLQPIAEDEFFYISGFVKFNRNPDGEVTGYTFTPSDEYFYFQGIEFMKIK